MENTKGKKIVQIILVVSALVFMLVAFVVSYMFTKEEIIDNAVSVESTDTYEEVKKFVDNNTKFLLSRAVDDSLTIPKEISKYFSPYYSNPDLHSEENIESLYEDSREMTVIYSNLYYKSKGNLVFVAVAYVDALRVFEILFEDGVITSITSENINGVFAEWNVYDILWV